MSSRRSRRIDLPAPVEWQPGSAIKGSFVDRVAGAMGRASFDSGWDSPDEAPYPALFGSKIAQFFKIWWMVFWRFFVIGLLFQPILNSLTMAGIFLGAAASAYLVQVRGKTFRSFPLIGYVNYHKKFPDFTVTPEILPKSLKPSNLACSGDYCFQTKPPVYPRTMAQNPLGWGYWNPILKDGAVAKDAVEPGYLTGYEPGSLQDSPPRGGRLVFGSPGAGLTGSGFGKAKTEAGQTGEENFYKALAKEGLLDKVLSFWSLNFFNEDLKPVGKSDIDCILVTNRSVFLIDLKMYKQGNLTYYSDGDEVFAIDNTNGDQVGDKLQASSQMDRVRSTFRALKESGRWGLKSHELRPYVVFMPTANGMGLVDCQWPGKVPAVPVTTVLEDIKADVREHGAHVPGWHDSLTTHLQSLTKG